MFVLTLLKVSKVGKMLIVKVSPWSGLTNYSACSYDKISGLLQMKLWVMIFFAVIDFLKSKKKSRSGDTVHMEKCSAKLP